MTEVFRIASQLDIPALEVFINAAYRGESSKVGWTTEADLLGGQRTDRDALATTLAQPGSVILLLLEDDKLTGCVNLQKRDSSVYIGMLTVAPPSQGSGLGKKLLHVAEHWAVKNWEVKKAQMTVIQQRHELLAWYIRRGYHNTQRVEEFPYGDIRFGEPKVDDLYFIVLEKQLSFI